MAYAVQRNYKFGVRSKRLYLDPRAQSGRRATTTPAETRNAPPTATNS